MGEFKGKTRYFSATLPIAYTVKKESFKTLTIELHTCFRCFDTPRLVVAWFVFQNTKMCFKERKMVLHTCVRCFDIPHLDVDRYVFQNTNMCFKKPKIELRTCVRCLDTPHLDDAWYMCFKTPKCVSDTGGPLIHLTNYINQQLGKDNLDLYQSNIPGEKILDIVFFQL